MSKVKKEECEGVITTTTVRRGRWRSNDAYAEVCFILHFPSFDILVMNHYSALVPEGGTGFWKMKATSNESFFLFPRKNKKQVEAIAPNGNRVRLSVEASGIVATVRALKMLERSLIVAAFLSRLLEYAQQHPEYPVLRSFIDGL